MHRLIGHYISVQDITNILKIFHIICSMFISYYKRQIIYAKVVKSWVQSYGQLLQQYYTGHQVSK